MVSFCIIYSLSKLVWIIFLFQAQRLGNNFKELLDTYGEEELPVKEMVEKLMTNTEKDDESLLPHIFPPEREYNLSSIFVDTNNPLVNLVSVPLWFRKCETYTANLLQFYKLTWQWMWLECLNYFLIHQFVRFM